MKRFLKITGTVLGILIALLIVIYFTATGPVVNTPFYESDYFKKSLHEIDSLKSVITPVNGSLKAIWFATERSAGRGLLNVASHVK